MNICISCPKIIKPDWKRSCSIATNIQYSIAILASGAYVIYIFTNLLAVICRIEDCDLPTICEFLIKHPEVDAVDLCYNNISDNGMITLAKFFETNRTVLYLDLMLNNIGPEGVKKLTALGEDLHLRSLRLNGNKIGREGGIYLVELLNATKTLTFLDIAETDQTIVSIVQLVAILRDTTTVNHIDFSRVVAFPYRDFEPDHFCEIIGTMMEVNNTIRELHLQKNSIDDHALKGLLEGLTKNKTLLMLDLACNHIGDHGAVFISEFLKMNPPLQALMLNHNNIRDTGAQHISYASTFSKNLTFLDLAHNNLTNAGLIHILWTIRKETHLLVLFIWGNKIGKESMTIIERFLNNRTLKQSTLDVIVYRNEFNELQMAYNSPADLYKQRYYSVIPKEKQKRDAGSLQHNDISFAYHNTVKYWEMEKEASRVTLVNPPARILKPRKFFL